MALLMSNKSIHDVDKPNMPSTHGGATLSDTYGQWVADAFFVAPCFETRVAICLTGSLGRSSGIAQAFAYEQPHITTQGELDKFLDENHRM